MSTPTLKIVLRKDKKKADGNCPIHIRVIKARKVSYISTGISVEPKFWDEENRKVRKGHPNSNRVNHFLISLLHKYIDAALNAESSSNNLSVKKIKEVVTGKSAPLFFEFAEEILARYKVKGNFGTHDKSVSVIKKIKDYTRNAPLRFEDLDTRFLAQYEAYLSSHHKNSPNTIAKDLKFIRTLFRYAIKEKLIKDEIDPFKGYKIKTEPTTKIILETQEIEVFKTYNGTDLMNRCRDIVLFQYYSGGIRISDALLLRVGSVANGQINLRIRKTGAQLTHRITDSANELFEKHKTNKEEHHRLFDFVPSQINDDDGFNTDLHISRATALINKVVKVIAHKVGIKKPISTHSFRHSFAVNALRKGMPVEIVQKILGHSNIRETMVYARVQNNEVNDLLSKFDK